MDHHVSHLFRLLSQAGSLCVSSAFGNGGVVFAVGPALHTFPLELSGEVRNFPASFSSSELSAYHMAPSGVIAHKRSRRALGLVDASGLFPIEPEVHCESVRPSKCNFATYLNELLRQEVDIVLCTLIKCLQVKTKRSSQA